MASPHYEYESIYELVLYNIILRDGDETVNMRLSLTNWDVTNLEKERRAKTCERNTTANCCLCGTMIMDKINRKGRLRDQIEYPLINTMYVESVNAGGKVPNLWQESCHILSICRRHA